MCFRGRQCWATHTHTHMHTHAHTHAHICTHAYTHACTHTHTHYGQAQREKGTCLLSHSSKSPGALKPSLWLSIQYLCIGSEVCAPQETSLVQQCLELRAPWFFAEQTGQSGARLLLAWLLCCCCGCFVVGVGSGLWTTRRVLRGCSCSSGRGSQWGGHAQGPSPRAVSQA